MSISKGWVCIAVNTGVWGWCAAWTPSGHHKLPEETMLSWGVWTALLRLFIKVHTRLKQLIACARERVAWQHSRDSWAVLMTFWRIVVCELVKSFSFKMGASQELREQNCVCEGKTNILGFPSPLPPPPLFSPLPPQFSFHWAARTSQLRTGPKPSQHCSSAPPIPHELSFSTAFLCCTQRHFSLNMLFTDVTLVSLYHHWILENTFVLLLVSPGDLLLWKKHSPVVH